MSQCVILILLFLKIPYIYKHKTTHTHIHIYIYIYIYIYICIHSYLYHLIYAYVPIKTLTASPSRSPHPPSPLNSLHTQPSPLPSPSPHPPLTPPSPPPTEYDVVDSLLILTEEEIIAVDLSSEDASDTYWPLYPLPYLSSIHASAITTAAHATNVPADFLEKLRQVGQTQMPNVSTRVRHLQHHLQRHL